MKWQSNQTSDVLVNPTNDPLLLVCVESQALIYYESVPAFMIAKTEFGVVKLRRREMSAMDEQGF